MSTFVHALLPRLRLFRSRTGGLPLRRLLGPGWLVAVGYVDPGNWATDIAAGAHYGYALLATVVLASLLGLLFQDMAARLAVATGQDLASLTRRHLPRPWALAAWIAGELAIVATALAELIGCAIALQLLLGTGLKLGMLLGAAGTLAVMALSQRRRNLHEHLVGVLLAGVALSFLYLLARAHPQPAAVASGFAHGYSILGDGAMLAMATAIVGATVMPHNLYLHSGLVAERSRGLDPGQRSRALRLSGRDTRLSLLLAMGVNAAMLVVAGTSLRDGAVPVENLAQAHRSIALTLGGGAALIFALGLYAAGQSSAITGVIAGRLLSRGFRGRRESAWRRGIATRLAGICLGYLLLDTLPGAGADGLLVLSQTLLGLALPFALLPLLRLAWRRELLGALAFRRGHLLLAAAATLLVLALDAYLVIDAL